MVLSKKEQLVLRIILLVAASALLTSAWMYGITTIEKIAPHNSFLLMSYNVYAYWTTFSLCRHIWTKLGLINEIGETLLRLIFTFTGLTVAAIFLFTGPF
jgi:hypothetical protein